MAWQRRFRSDKRNGDEQAVKFFPERCTFFLDFQRTVRGKSEQTIIQHKERTKRGYRQ